MESLLAASAKRTEHELAAHHYRHPVAPPPAPLTYGASVSRRSRAREI